MQNLQLKGFRCLITLVYILSIFINCSNSNLDCHYMTWLPVVLFYLSKCVCSLKASVVQKCAPADLSGLLLFYRSEPE